MTRDRRKESAKEADQRLAELQQAYAENATDAAAAAEEEAGAVADSVGLVLDDVFANQSQFEAVLHTLRVLLGSGQPGEAQALTDNIMRMFSNRGTGRCGSIFALQFEVPALPAVPVLIRGPYFTRLHLHPSLMVSSHG